MRLALALLLAAGAAQAAPHGAGFYDTSEYLAGRVAVNIVFVQCDGGVDACSQTTGWTAGKKSSVLSEIQAGMNWWAQRNSAAGISFVYNDVTVNTGYEPIGRSSADEGLWVAQVMSRLGYNDADYYDRVYSYNNDRRDAAGADWSFTYFVVDSQQDADGQFSDGFFAYAYLGGPFSVMTYDNDGYGINNMDAVAAHEMGHIFYALDEYYDSGCTAAQHAGYLNGFNLNCEDSGGNAPSACIMRGDVPPYNSNSVCAHTQKMLGWTDANSNSKLDILDFAPTVALNAYTPDPTTNVTPVFTGAAHSTAAYANANTYSYWEGARTPNNITISRVAAVEYRVDGGAWQQASASDGSFNGHAENFTFTSPALADGAHTFAVRSKDSFNSYYSATASDPLTVSVGLPSDITFVQDGAASDIDYSNSRSRARANWGPSSHANGINRYEFALATYPVTYQSVSWTSAGTSSWTAVTASLTEGNTYFFSVRAVANITSDTSGISVSDGFRVDLTSPTAQVIVTSSVPARTGAFSAKLVLTEANPMAATPQLRLRTSTGQLVPLTLTFLTGSTWTAAGAIESYHSTGTASFVFEATDQAGNRGTVISPAASVAINYALSGGSSGTVSNSDGFGVYLPPSSYSGTLFVSVSTVAAAVLDAASAGGSEKIDNIDLARSFTARDGAGAAVTSFPLPVTITLAYPDADSDGRVDSDLTKENTLWIYYLDQAQNKWTPLPGVTRDTASNTLSVQTDHFSIFSIRSSVSSATGMGALRAYPNPCDFRRNSHLKIDGLPVDAEGTRVYIYNSAGELVRTLSYEDPAEVDGLNVASWDGAQEGGAKAASGLYLYLVKTSNYGKATGKFFVIW